MVNSSKTKVPLKFSWSQVTNTYHIVIIVNNILHKAYIYVGLCEKDIYISDMNEYNFIWPNGIECKKLLMKSTVCSKCLNLYGEDLTFPLIKAKLGVKNPFD